LVCFACSDQDYRPYNHLLPQFKIPSLYPAITFELFDVFHLWRVPVAVVFFHYGSQHLLPETFVRNAAWGDLLAGLFVVPLLLLPNYYWKY
jgi:hypothetical protein